MVHSEFLGVLTANYLAHQTLWTLGVLLVCGGFLVLCMVVILGQCLLGEDYRDGPRVVPLRARIDGRDLPRSKSWATTPMPRGRRAQ